MRRFGPEFADMDTDAILSEYKIYKTPDYVYFKGEGKLLLAQKDSCVMELSLLEQGIGISGADINAIRIWPLWFPLPPSPLFPPFELPLL